MPDGSRPAPDQQREPAPVSGFQRVRHALRLTQARATSRKSWLRCPAPRRGSKGRISNASDSAASSWIEACVGRKPPGCNVRGLVKKDSTPETSAPARVRVAYSTTTDHRYALVIRQTRPTTPLDTEAEAQPASFASWTVASLAVMFATGPDRRAVISIAEPIPTLPILHASSIRYILGPRSGWTVVADCPIESGERPHRCRRAGKLPRIHRGNRPRDTVSGMFDMPSPWRRLNR